jgi:Cu/Ag efflux pump CusA
VPSLRVEYDRGAIARHGLRVADVARALEVVTSGAEVGQVLEGMNAFGLVLRAGAVGDLTADVIADALVDTPSGAKIPLKALAAIREDRSPNFISRENVQRRITVTCNVAGRDMRGVVEDVRRAIESEVQLPAGYYVEYGGQFESAETTGRLLQVLGVVIVVGIAALLFFLFRSLRDTLLVMLNLPLALIGGVLGVFLAGGTLSVASIIGFITVFGVAARNGIMLVSHIRHLQEVEGVREFRQAVRTGAMERFAPILMTALAAGLALVPLALRGDRPGNEILTPMAIVILSGLMSSTLLNMLLVPSLYLRFGRPPASETAPETTLEASHA